MAMSKRVKLINEYAKRYSIIFRILEISGFCRFIIRDGNIIARKSASVLYNVFVMIIIDFNAAVMLWTANIGEQTLSAIEFGAIIHFAIFSNLLLYQITFVNNYIGPDIIQNCIELDCYLDAKETEFMRHKTMKIYTYGFLLTMFTQISIVSYLYYLFHVSLIIHFCGSLFFFWIFCAYHDYTYSLYLFWFLTTRARYLNVALLNITRMNIEYIPKQWLFHKILWDDKYDGRVTFHVRDNKDFCVAYKMLFNILRYVEQCFRFPVVLGFCTVIMGSFVTVQTFIMYVKDSTAMGRAGAITAWAIATWFFFILLTVFFDMFYKQIEQTKLICAYIQLKPTSSDAMLKLMKKILNTLDLREARASLYDIFYVDTSLVFKLAASTFVYITVQLQLAFPNLEDRRRLENITKIYCDVLELNRNLVKEFLFLY